MDRLLQPGYYKVTVEQRVAELLTQDGQTLTPAGEKFVEWLAEAIDIIIKRAEDLAAELSKTPRKNAAGFRPQQPEIPAALAGAYEAAKNYRGFVVATKTFTPAAYFKAYPSAAMTLWELYTAATQDMPVSDKPETSAATDEQPAAESAPPLVANGQLTPEGQSLTVWLAESAAADMTNHDKPVHQAAIRDYQHNIEDGLTPAEIFTGAPGLSELLQESYQLTHPNPKEKTTMTKTPEAPPQLAYMNGTLTKQGRELTEWLSRYIPDNAAGRGYFAFVTRGRMMTAGRYFLDFPNAGDSLWKTYTECSPAIAAQEAAKHLQAAEKLLDDLRQRKSASQGTSSDGAFSEAATDALAQSKAAIAKLQAAMKGYQDADA